MSSSSSSSGSSKKRTAAVIAATKFVAPSASQGPLQTGMRWVRQAEAADGDFPDSRAGQDASDDEHQTLHIASDDESSEHEADEDDGSEDGESEDGEEDDTLAAWEATNFFTVSQTQQSTLAGPSTTPSSSQGLTSRSPSQSQIASLTSARQDYYSAIHTAASEGAAKEPTCYANPRIYRKRVNEEFKHYPRLFVEQELQEYLTANDVNVDVLRHYRSMRNDPIPGGFSEFGYSYDTEKRLEQHAKHDSSNYLMNIVDALCMIYFPEYKLYHFVMHHVLVRNLAELAEMYFTRAGQGYSRQGGQQVRPAGNTHTPLRKLAIARILENDADAGMSILADSVGGQKTQTGKRAMGSYLAMAYKDARNNKPGSNKLLLFGVPATLVKNTSEELHDQLGDEVNVFVYGNNISPSVSDTVKTNVYFDKDNVAFKSYNGRHLHNDYTAERLSAYIYRMILDEPHHWRNCEKTKGGQALLAFQARSVLLVTATSIVNSLEDLCGYLAFCPKHGEWSQEVDYNEMLNPTDRDERWIDARAQRD
ncbi:hypothetical protein LTR97_007735 [Elasticomyces elasticus]|uniref:SNF2 N-terminal domain-containing protein n=1 Tax=Elasticomyces elasticus TaxID=574655 RepID=A0AAN7W3S9_9PEZI|nr:hypothetical protein LTR97_007735 [Elasticomyces elasticus]